VSKHLRVLREVGAVSVRDAGTPYFPPLDKPLELRQVKSRTFGSGVVYLRYERSRS
jgi:hypothetical protein